MRERYQLHDRVELLGAVPNHLVREVWSSILVYGIWYMVLMLVVVVVGGGGG
jgi:hypothetical protein